MVKKRNKNHFETDIVEKQKNLYYKQNRMKIIEWRIVTGVILCFIALIAFIIIRSITGDSAIYNVKSDSLKTGATATAPTGDEVTSSSATEQEVDYTKSIICWGDSFSDNNANSTNFYTYYLTENLYLRSADINSVFSSGVSGDNLLTIAAKQGGVPMVAEPFTIPAGKQPVEISLRSTFDENMGIILQDKLNSGLNPCTIGGVEGTIEYVRGKLSFTRTTAGDEVTLKEPTTVITNAMANIKGYVGVYFFGGSPTRYTPEETVEIYRAMVDSVDNERYVVLSPVIGDADTLAPYEEALNKEFKNHFINLREYLTTDVFNNYDLNLSSADAKSLREGSVPPSLILNGRQLSDEGSKIVADLLFDKLLQLEIIK